MSEVIWPSDPRAFEKGIAVLLSLMHGDVQRIDGSGGDRGRDAQFIDNDGLHVFEMKSFRGRMTPSRKSQVADSLETAAALSPVSWDLIVPIDPTPGELNWFEDLCGRYPFKMTWRGAAWIEARLAEHPQVRRFYFGDAMAETSELLRQLLREQGPVGDVGDALDRMRGMCVRLNELEPHYTFRMTAGPGLDSMVEMLPAYPGAVRDRPMGFWLAFAESPEAQVAAQAWEQAIAFGDPVEISGEHLTDFQVSGPTVLGLPRGLPDPGMTLRVAAHTVPADHAAQLVVENGHGRRVAVLGVRMTSLRAGTHGGVLSGTDATGSFQCRLRMDHSTGRLRVELELEVADRLRPVARLEVVRFASALLPHHTMRVMLGGQPLTDPKPVPVLPGMNQEAADAMIELLEQLVTVEHLAVTAFELPSQIPAHDKAAIRTAHALLTGRTAELDSTATAIFETADSTEIRELVANHGRVQVSGVEDDYSVAILGQSIVVGTVTVETPPLQITGADPVDTGLRVSARTAPDHAGERIRVTPHRPTSRS
ncbi:hypothetical protein OG741_21790 [Streptomyces sp. NBC_01410]|uniref:hypothetical protein n=1 Tax=Streptomyces sp. NBC_01410 TaxID=2903856 RepID=UPI00324AA73E